MRAQDPAEGVGRIAHFDLDSLQPALEEPAKPTLPRELVLDLSRRTARGQAQVADVLSLLEDQVVIVVSGQEHEPPSLQALAQQVEQLISGRERVVHGAEEEIEQVPEEAHLVDARRGGEPGAPARPDGAGDPHPSKRRGESPRSPARARRSTVSSPMCAGRRAVSRLPVHRLPRSRHAHEQRPEDGPRPPMPSRWRRRAGRCGRRAAGSGRQRREVSA